MDPSMKDFGKMIYNMDQEWITRQKLQDFQEIFLMAKELDQEAMSGMMELNILVNGGIIRQKDMGFTHNKMEGNIQDNGIKIK